VAAPALCALSETSTHPAAAAVAVACMPAPARCLAGV
jgi:hypothetical protein